MSTADKSKKTLRENKKKQETIKNVLDKKDQEKMNQLVDLAKEEKNKDPKQKNWGKYKDYILIWHTDHELYSFVKTIFESKSGTFTTNKLYVIRWSSLSRDLGDFYDFGVKYEGE